MNRTIYISGPMRGYPEFNFPMFHKAHQYIERKWTGPLTIHNPAAKDLDQGFDPNRSTQPSDKELETWMRRDLTDVAASDRILLLPGWEASEGVSRELAVARWCGVRPWIFAERDWDLCGSERWGCTTISWKDVDAALEQAKREANPIGHAKAATPKRNIFGQIMDTTLKNYEPAFKAQLDNIYGDEIRSVSLTGGEKGVKPARHDLMSPKAETAIARVFGYGAAKYEDHNWRRGYEWSKSYAALQRHLNAWNDGEDIDPESGEPHLAHAGAHIHFLLEWADTHPEFDDRYKA